MTFNISFDQLLIFILFMRKQIVFEQNSPQTCLINTKNIFGFSINYVEDKIKRHSGKWNSKTRKFEIPLKQMPELSKQLQEIDRSYYIEQVPSIVGELVNKCWGAGSKVKKQILVDEKIVKRYEYVEQNVIKSILNNSKGSNASKNYHKILIITMECKIISWMQKLSHYKCRKIKFQANEIDTVLREDNVWLCSYQNIWSRTDSLNKYCFQTVIVDEAENLAYKLSSQQEAGLSLKKMLLSRHFLFPIITKMHLNRLEILIPLLSLIIPTMNIQWFSRRYRRQNISELNFLVKFCNLTRDLSTTVKKERVDGCKYFFNKIIQVMSEQGVQKIKWINKKNNQIEQRKILQDPLSARHKNQRVYLQSIFDVLRNEKLQIIQNLIEYYCVSLNIKVAIIIETSLMYRSIQNFLCEHQIAYCHYEQPQEVCEFNKNPTKMVCLIKSQYLLGINFSKPLRTKDETINAKLQNYEPEQYLCLSGVCNVLFPDIDWLSQVNRKQQSIRQLFLYSHTDIIRHYFILKGSYEQKWMKTLQETIIKVQMSIKMKEDLASDSDNDQEELPESKDPVLGFTQINLAKVQQQYSHLKIIKGVTDIDEQFDRLEFEALQQKLQKQSKKKRKQAKAEQKKQEKVLQLEDRERNKGEQSKQENESIEIDSEEQYEMFLKKKINSNRNSNMVENVQVSIYQPNNQCSKILQEVKNADDTKDANKINQNKSIYGDVVTGEKIGIDQSVFVRQIKDRGGQVQGTEQGEIDNFKQDETEEVEIIEVRKPKPKAKIPKPKSQNMSIILRPSVLG